MLIDLIEQKDYFYHCKIYYEYLIDGMQVEIFKAGSEDERKSIKEYANCCDPDHEEPEGWSELRWHSRGSTSFADKDFEGLVKHIKREIELITKGEYILQHGYADTYIVYFKTPIYLDEPVLTRMKFYIYRHAIIDQKDDFVETLLKERED